MRPSKLAARNASNSAANCLTFFSSAPFSSVTTVTVVCSELILVLADWTVVCSEAICKLADFSLAASSPAAVASAAAACSAANCDFKRSFWLRNKSSAPASGPTRWRSRCKAALSAINCSPRACAAEYWSSASASCRRRLAIPFVFLSTAALAFNKSFSFINERICSCALASSPESIAAGWVASASLSLACNA